MNITKTLLLEIDVQNDFCPAYLSASGVQYPDGALAVNDGGGVIAPLNRLAAVFAAQEGRVAATQDWHPRGHVSFASSHADTRNGNLASLWPDHCVRGERGAAFHENLDLKPVNLIIRKGFHKGLDSYSAFFENDRVTPTGLEGWTRGLDIDTIIIGGLAADYCVLYSAMDSKKLGFTTIIVSDAVRGVNVPAGSVERAFADMRAAGIIFANSEELLDLFGGREPSCPGYGGSFGL